MKLKETLLNISKEIDNNDFDYINSGGCCWFAAHISRELEKRNIPFKIIFECPSDDEYYMEDQANGNNYGCSGSHIFLGIDNIFYDSDGLRENEWGTIYKWNSEQLMTFHKRGDWNNTFKEYRSKDDRREIVNIIKQEFKRYDTTDSIRH